MKPTTATGASSLRPSALRGVTLVELMVAIVLGLILTAAVAQIYLSSRTAYVMQEGLARVQEGARFAMEFLSTDLRMAGYKGCVNSSTKANNILNDTSLSSGLDNRIAGYAYVGPGSALTDWQPDLPGAVFPSTDVRPIRGTDVVFVYSASAESFPVTTPWMPTASAALHIAKGTSIQVGDILIVSDCKSADVFQVTGPNDPSNTGTINHNTGASQTPGNRTQSLSKTYKDGSEILRLIARVYFIGRRGNDPNNPPALFRKDFNGSRGGWGSAVELVENIEGMRLLFGEDTDANNVVDIYRRADSVSDWTRVKSVRVAIVSRTPETVDLERDAKTFTVSEFTFGPYNDRYRRHAFVSTVLLRN